MVVGAATKNLMNLRGGYIKAEAEVALRLAEKNKKHPKLWQWFFMVA